MLSGPMFAYFLMYPPLFNLYPHMEGLLASEISGNLISTTDYVKGDVTPRMRLSRKAYLRIFTVWISCS